MDKPIDVLHEFPVRKSGKQKAAFREAVLAYGALLGYNVEIEKGSLGVRNVVFGDPETAKYLITAHYDTCAWMPFPNLITPCNFGLYLCWQLLLTAVLCVPAGLIGGLIGAFLQSSDLAVSIAYLLLLIELTFLMIGPANKYNANDNTSGVVTVLETAAAMPQELRQQVCFVLFDLEEAGLLGSAAYRKKHRKASSNQLVINLDCVGEGDSLLLIPTAKARKNKSRMEALGQKCPPEGKKHLQIKDRGFCFYPSDQTNFPIGLGVAAFCRSKWAGLYLGKIHTARDKVLDDNNVALLRDYLISIVRSRV